MPRWEEETKLDSLEQEFCIKTIWTKSGTDKDVVSITIPCENATVDRRKSMGDNNFIVNNIL